MEPDEKIRWLETRINSSMKPRNEDLKNMYLNDENRLALHAFINNEDIRRLYVYVIPPRQICAALQPPNSLTSKSIFFVKNSTGVKLTKENMDDEINYMDCTENLLQECDILCREVYLPLLCSEQGYAYSHGMSPDRLMDLMHRFMGSVQVTKGNSEGDIILPMPSIEVLADAAGSTKRRGSVLHVLETTVIDWIKQIKGLLKHSPLQDLAQQSGDNPGPLEELQLWKTRQEKLQSICDQLSSPVAVDILRNLNDAKSTYGSSFQHVIKDIRKAEQDAKEVLMFLGTMENVFEDLHFCYDAHKMLELFTPLVHTLFLVWQHSRYYHQKDKFHNMLRLISNSVVRQADLMVGEDVLREPLQSYSKLKEALRVCAAFRGTYLDYRDKAYVINEKNKQEHAEKMFHRPKNKYQLFSTKMYGSNAFQPTYGFNRELEEEALREEEELWKDSPWPPRNAPAFDLLNAFMERCNDVLELVQTTRHFHLLKDAAEVGGAGKQSLDSLVKEIHQNYTKAMQHFFSQVSNVLNIDGSESFEMAFFTFRTVVKDLERKLAGVLRESFLQCPTIISQLRLLEVFEGIGSRELVQAHLKDKDEALVRMYTEELMEVKGMFQSDKKSPPSLKNVPPIVSKLTWIRAISRRIEEPMIKKKKVPTATLR